MKLGNFFADSPHARPVNPKAVTFTATARGKVLPGGKKNADGRVVAATVTGALVLIGEETSAIRVEARRALSDRFQDNDGAPLPVDELDVYNEIKYQILWRAMYEWDAENHKVADRLFPSVKSVRELVEVREVDRLVKLYNDYVEEEHPEVVDRKTFRGAQNGSDGASEE